jgi:hypothetical protein
MMKTDSLFLQGKAELKFVHEDGREAVFDGDTLQFYRDPRFVGTYNYVNPVAASEVRGVGSALKFVGKNIGHFVTDVIPYAVLGNVRGKDETVAKRFESKESRIIRLRNEVERVKQERLQKSAEVDQEVEQDKQNVLPVLPRVVQ